LYVKYVRDRSGTFLFCINPHHHQLDLFEPQTSAFDNFLTSFFYGDKTKSAFLS